MMAPRSTVVILATSAALALAGCGAQQKPKKIVPEFATVEAKSVADFFPHAADDTWEYVGNRNGDPNDWISYNQRVSSRANGPGGFAYTTEYPGQEASGSEVYEIRDNTIYFLIERDPQFTEAQTQNKPPKPLLKFPVVQDATWTWEGEGPAPVGYCKHSSRFRVDNNILLTTKTGKFHTVRVEEDIVSVSPEFKGTRQMVVSYYAAGYGLVRRVVYDGQSRVLLELSQSTLLKGPGMQRQARGG